MSEAFEPGVYPNVKNEVYHAAPGWSTSDLKKAKMSVTLAEKKEIYRFDTSSMALGRAVHTLVLEPSKFIEEIAVEPVFNKRTNDGKQAAVQFAKDNAGKLILSQEEFDKASAMAESVRAIYGHVLSDIDAEMSVFADDDGLMRKCRPDALGSSGTVIFDLKTSKDDFGRFGRSTIYEYDYDMQAAWYLDTCQMAGLDVDQFAFIVVMNTKPYYAYGYGATSSLIESGREKYKAILERIANKRMSNSDTLFHPAVVPEWRMAQMVMGG